MKPKRNHLLWLGVAVMISLSTSAQAANDGDKQAELEKKFEKAMNNVVLVGSFTVKGRENKLTTERYVISKVVKVQDGFWLFHARIQYNRTDLNVPLLLEVKWAGDTPVIVVDKVKVPGGGTYTARVLIYDNQYVGTWDAGDHGGQMFGRIEPNKGEAPAPNENENEKKNENKKNADGNQE